MTDLEYTQAYAGMEHEARHTNQLINLKKGGYHGNTRSLRAVD